MSKLKQIAELSPETIVKMSGKLFGKNLMPNEKTMIWKINSSCNLDCHYCHDMDETRQTIYSPEQVEQAFDRHGYKWFINITGGEPFFYPGFIEILQRLLNKHYVSVNSNLTSENIGQLFQGDGLKNLLGINASFHPEELEKSGKKKIFFENVKSFRDLGVAVVVSLVAHPQILERLEQYISEIRDSAQNDFSLRFFYGSFNGVSYPASYSNAERILIEKHILPPTEFPYKIHLNKYKGKTCYAGNSHFYVKPDGQMCRCMSDTKPLGNFITEETTLPSKAVKCKVDNHPCLFECFYNYSPGFLERFINKTVQ